MVANPNVLLFAAVNEKAKDPKGTKCFRVLALTWLGVPLLAEHSAGRSDDKVKSRLSQTARVAVCLTVSYQKNAHEEKTKVLVLSSSPN